MSLSQIPDEVGLNMWIHGPCSPSVGVEPPVSASDWILKPERGVMDSPVTLVLQRHVVSYSYPLKPSLDAVNDREIVYLSPFPLHLVFIMNPMTEYGFCRSYWIQVVVL